MPWVYRTLFEASGLDLDRYLPLRRLDPAFRVVLTDGRTLDIPADAEGLRAAFAAIDPADGVGLDRFLAKMDRFARCIGHAYCDRMLENWSQVLLSPLMLSAALVSPAKSYASEIDEHFRSREVRELLYGFPTYSGFDPKSAPASLAIIPWTIIREGVWYPASGGVAAIPRALLAACRDLGVDVRTGVEVEAIERDAEGRVRGVSTSSGFLPASAVVSNADYVQTHRMLRGGTGFSPEVERLRAGDAQPSSSFFTIQLAADRTWDGLAHHLLVLTEGSSRVYDELFERGEYPSDPPIYVNATCVTDPGDAPPGCSNPFVVIGAPPLREGEEPDRDFESRYADRMIARLERSGLPGLGRGDGGPAYHRPERLARPLRRLPGRDLRAGQPAQRPRGEFPAPQLPRRRPRALLRRRGRPARRRDAHGRPERQDHRAEARARPVGLASQAGSPRGDRTLMATVPFVLALLAGSVALAWTGLALRLLSRVDAYRPLDGLRRPHADGCPSDRRRRPRA